tara:strand:+ start:13 stop:867 length:855 start_codon:yes stop_codon:yes gene_type:complete
LSLPKHTPYRNGDGGVKVGLEPIEEADWLEIDNLFDSEIELKKKLYESYYKEIHQELDLSLKSQQELLEMLKTHLNQYHPNHKFTTTETSAPLKNASLMVQEDLVLMLPKKEKYFLGAASLCAPSNWSLKEKFNGSLLELHKDVPSYEREIGNRVNNLFNKLPNDRIFQRFNWSIYEEATLFQPAKSKSFVERSKTITNKNAGDRLFIRVERQTIRRLPETKAIAFTIRVHVDPLSSIKDDLSLVRDLKKALKNLSEGMKRYKSLGPIETPLLGWLDNRIKSLS